MLKLSIKESIILIIKTLRKIKSEFRLKMIKIKRKINKIYVFRFNK